MVFIRHSILNLQFLSASDNVSESSGMTYRLCLPKLINDIELCQYVTENKTYAQSQYGFNVTSCKTCTSDFCNGSPAYLGSVVAIILSVLTMLHVIY